MDDIYIYTVTLPPGVSEAVTPCTTGFTVYLSDRLDQQGRIEAYEHALRHIQSGDFNKDDVQQIEAAASGK